MDSGSEVQADSSNEARSERELVSGATSSTMAAVPSSCSATYRSQACGGMPSISINTL